MHSKDPKKCKIFMIASNKNEKFQIYLLYILQLTYVNENSLSNFPVSSLDLVFDTFDTPLELKLKWEKNLLFVSQPFAFTNLNFIISILLYCQVCHLNIV